jgi:hypothetical protein
LLIIERLIGDDGEPKFLRVKIQRPVLIGDGNADEFDLFDHGEPSVKRPAGTSSRTPQLKPESAVLLSV